MKIFKRIWYCALAILLIISLSVGISSAYGTGSIKGLPETSLKSITDYVTALRNGEQQDYIEDRLLQVGYRESFEVEATDEDNNIYLTFPTQMANGAVTASVAFQQQLIDERTSEALSQRYATDEDSAVSAVNIEPRNIVVYIPGNISKSSAGSGDVLLFYTRYNRTDSTDSENIPTAALLLNAIENISLSYDNDFVLLFADASEGEDLGLYTFLNQFDGFDDVITRIKSVVDLDSLGNSGAMNLISAEGDYSFISKVNSITGKGMSSSIISSLYESSIGKTDKDLFDCAYARIANSNGLNFYESVDGEELSEKTLVNYSNSIYNLMSVFGNYDLASIKTGAKVYCFNFFGLSIALPYIIAYLFAALIVILFAAVIFFNMKKKAFTVPSLAKGAGVQLLSLLITGAIMFVSYYLMLLVLSLLTVIPVQAIAVLRYSGGGILASMLLLSIPAIIGSQMICKKLFNCKAADVVRGNVVILAVVGIIFAFLPKYGFVFSILAVLELIILLISVFSQQKYYEKHNDSLGKLFLYIIPVIILLPILINEIAVITAYSYLVYLPLMSVAFAMLIGFVTPYFGMMKPAMQKLVDKLPKRTVRVAKTVTEMVEDKAKKGKFTEQTVTKIEKETIDRKYKNRYLVIALAIVLIVVNLLVGGIGVDIGKNITVKALEQDSIYRNSLVFVYDADSDTTSFEIYDPIVYSRVSMALDGFEWDSEKGAYVKPTPKITEVMASTPSVDRDENIYHFNVGNSTRGQVKLNLSGIEKVTKITVVSFVDGENFDIELDNKSGIELILPSGFGNFDLEVEGLESDAKINISYKEVLKISEDDINSRYSSSSDWGVLVSYNDFNETLIPYLRGGAIFTMTKSL